MTSETRAALTKDEAIEALRQAAFQESGDPADATCGHPGCTEHAPAGRTLIHSFRGGIGADWDLAVAEKAVREAQDVCWTWDLFRHDLAVMDIDGNVVWFDVRRPGR